MYCGMIQDVGNWAPIRNLNRSEMLNVLEVASEKIIGPVA